MREGEVFFGLEHPLDSGAAPGMMRASKLHGFNALVRSYGANPHRILEKHGIDPAAVVDPENFIPCRETVQMLEYCRTAFNDSLFGLRLGLLQSPDIFGCVTSMARAAATFREGLQCFVDFLPVMHSTDGMLEIGVIEDVAELRWRASTDLGANEQAIYQTLTANIHILSMLSGNELHPLYVNLSVQVLRRDLDELEATMGCLVRGGARGNAIGFSADVMDRPLASSNRLLFNLLRQYFMQVQTMRKTSPLDDVERHVQMALSEGNCSIIGCAKRLGMSVRSLQLRLADYGVQFSDIVEKYRANRAMQLLRDDNCSFFEIACSLGYSEQSSFTRAFKRWTGMTPQAYRGARGPLAAAAN